MNHWIPYLSLAYLLGSIPFGYLLVLVFRNQDIRAHGSGNIGATNVARSGAKGLGIATLLLDLGKGLAAVAVARYIAGGNYDVMVAAGVVAVFGHCFPVWLGFKGGKGVATALGVVLGLTWLTGLATLTVFLLVFATTRFVSLASIVAAATIPLFALYFVSARTPLMMAGFFLLPLLIIAKHHENITRLLHGTENRFGRKAQA